MPVCLSKMLNCADRQAILSVKVEKKHPPTKRDDLNGTTSQALTLDEIRPRLSERVCQRISATKGGLGAPEAPPFHMGAPHPIPKRSVSGGTLPNSRG